MKQIKSFKSSINTTLDNYIDCEDDEGVEIEFIVVEPTPNQWDCFITNIHEGDVNDLLGEDTKITKLIEDKIKKHTNDHNLKIENIHFIGDY